jgi:hypothetical protein
LAKLAPILHWPVLWISPSEKVKKRNKHFMRFVHYI